MRLPAFLFVPLLAAALLSGLHAADSLQLRWEVPPLNAGGSFNFVTDSGDTERGLAYNPATNNVLLVSRAVGTGVYVLPALDGTFSHTLNLDGVFGGIFDLNVIGVSDDGAIFACPLVVNSTSFTSGPKAFKIYRWADDDPETIPTIAWEGDPAGEDEMTGESLNLQRWGDAIVVRGSGRDTQIVLPTRASSLAAVFTTTDGEEFEPTLLPNAANSQNTGVAFGTGDTIYFKHGSEPLRLVEFDLTTKTSTLLQSFTTLDANSRPIGTDPSNGRLAAVLTGSAVPESLELFDISSPTIPPIFSDSATFPVDLTNINAAGAVAFGPDVVFALSTNNGLVAYNIIDDNETAPPAITTQPAGPNVIAGGPAEFSVVVSGSPPFTFQWFKDEAAIPEDATGSTYSIPAVVATNAGDYTVSVTNAAGMITSDPATLTVTPRTNSPVAEPKWIIGIDDRPYLAHDSAQRGLAFNPVSGRILVASRTGGAQIRVLDGATGEDLHPLNFTNVAGGLFPINVVTAADDGAIYGANLSLSAADFKIYRWADDESVTFPEVVYDSTRDDAPIDGRRFGDTITARGSGDQTQILCATRTTNQVVVFTPSGDGFLIAHAITVSDVDSAADNFGLGVAFGSGNTFWGKTIGRALFHCSFTIGNPIGTLLNTFATSEFPASIGAIAVDPAANYLAGISNESPDNVQVFDISDLSAPPVLLDQEFFASDNANDNGTGALAFGPGILVALGTNNGILALTIDGGISSELTFTEVATINGGAQLTFTFNGRKGSSYRIETSTDLSDRGWTELQTITLSGTTTQTFTFATSLERRFFRAVTSP
jgi:hypothetical protein